MMKRHEIQVLLQAADRRLGLSEALAECLRDPRQPGKLTHSQLELLRQRIFGIALGYPDANDAQGLAEDPIHKLLLPRASGASAVRFTKTWPGAGLRRAELAGWQVPEGPLCLSGCGPEHTRVGALVYDGQLGDSLVTVRCWTRGFSLDGQHTLASPCDTFEVLSK